MGTNTGIGIGIGIPFKNNVLGKGKPYLPPEIKDSLKAVVIAYGKTNNDSDRAIVKNLVDPDNPFVISNAAYKLNSGFGKYEVDFTSWIQTNGVIASSDKVQNSIIGRFLYFNTVNKKEDVPSFKVNITLGQQGKLQYNYIKEDGTSTYIVYSEAGIYTIPASYFSKYTGGNAWFGFYQIEGTSIIEQIPSFEGAFVTDGINDLITSTKTVQEMLGRSNEITVVSMMANLDSRQILCNSNFSNTNRYNVRNTLEPNGVISMLGYTNKNGTTNNLNLIMGDKDSIKLTDKVNFNSDYVFYPAQYYKSYYQVAWYWTIIANKVLTTDQINQVIAYYNLDRTLKPDILCNIERQGITNDNHADFNDKLIDYSGNGRDIQMNNIAWKGGSGVAAKKFETIKDYLIVPDEGLQELTIYNEFSYKVKSIKRADRYWTVQSLNKTDVSYPITIIADKDIIWRNILNYTDENGVKGNIRKETNVSANVPTQIQVLGFNDFDVPDNYTKVNCVAYVTRNDITEFTVTFIPSCKGGIILDGIEDFGKVTGMPIYKDYTIVVDYERISGIEQAWAEALISKAYIADQGAFVLMKTNGMAKHSYSFGAYTTFNKDDSTRTLLYQSKYKCGDVDLNAGTGVDGDTLWLGTYRDNYSSFFNGAIYSLMSFPYSMSEFLIERQLKKYKLGTLYPDMVEFRPVIKANANYKITYYQIDSTNTWKSIKIGDYIVIGAKLAFQITFDNDASELKEVVSPQLSGIIVEKIPSNPGYNIYSYITSKSPQKINITIDEYIRFEDIVQPYPSIINLMSIDKTHFYTYGDKLKVGDVILYNSYKNLLKGLYSLNGRLKYNGVYIDERITVAKEMVFSWTVSPTWLLDNNEPKVILSPSRLRMPNSSYKILGHIPDISGHGNHGVIHNSAYAEMSGVNEDGSYQFDGVDDFVTIPTVTGGKQVLMKVNWQSNVGAVILYDQRLNLSDYEFAIYNGTKDLDNNPVMAYQGRNNGQTYINGILNSNIMASELKAITHNITITNELSLGINNTYPVIGSTRSNTYFAQMSLYDFMLFDEISTDDKIKQLNEYVGIEAKVELPPYYWDNYGKTNLDADKATIY